MSRLLLSFLFIKFHIKLPRSLAVGINLIFGLIFCPRGLLGTKGHAMNCIRSINKIILGGFFILTSFFIWTNTASALTVETIEKIDWRFNNPGARANGMGGAFIATADDASAAYSNPAGLTVLKKPEIAVEYKFTEYETIDRIRDQFTNQYYDNKTTNKVSNMSFLSFAYPSDKTTVTVYRHALVNTDTSIKKILGNNLLESSMQINVTSFGISCGFKVNNDMSLGLGVGLADLDIDYAEPFVGTFQRSLSANETEAHGSIGLKWDISKWASLGAIYRYGPKFTFVSETVREVNNAPMIFKYEDWLKVPDMYGLGLSLRLTGQFLISAEINRILYSQLLDKFNDRTTTINNEGLTVEAKPNYKIDDALDMRVGVEYIRLMSGIPFAIRGGYHFDPQHKVYYKRKYDSERDFILADRMPKAKDEHHITLGFGVVPSANIQIDVAGSRSQSTEEYTISAVYRFD
jgi:long-chain fatty acid transport protein